MYTWSTGIWKRGAIFSQSINCIYKNKLISDESFEIVRNSAFEMAHTQKMITSNDSKTVHQYVEHQYQDSLSRLNSNIIACLGECLTDEDWKK